MVCLQGNFLFHADENILICMLCETYLINYINMYISCQQNLNNWEASLAQLSLSRKLTTCYHYFNFKIYFIHLRVVNVLNDNNEVVAINWLRKSCCLLNYFLRTTSYVSYCFQILAAALLLLTVINKSYVRSASIRSYSGPYFSAIGLNTERYSYLSAFTPNARN